MPDEMRAAIRPGRSGAGGDFGSTLRTLRLAAGLSQEELAERAGTGVNTISSLERGARRAPYRSTVESLADALALNDAQRDVLRAAAVRRRAPADVTHLRSEGPAPGPATPANNLPRQFTAFVGREREIAEIMALVDANRLVTVCGFGGIGKTRTSLEVAADLSGEFRDGTWLIEFGALTNPDYVAPSIARTLGIAIGPGADPVAAIVDALRPKHTLLVFDTCEHLIAASADVAAALLRGTPHVRILATSRQNLGIAGESTYRLPPLDVPARRTPVPTTAPAALAYDAVALFVDRAVRVNDRFRLSDENAGSVVHICRRLDGIALAIELAAARSTALGPAQIADHLDERLRLLRTNDRGMAPRQQTLRALIDWSYDLLDEPERTLFARVAIFAKDFSLGDAIAIGTNVTTDRTGVLAILDSLVEKSLVTAGPAGESLRYSLLDSTRVYAWEKLSRSADFEEIARRHLRHLRDRFAASYALAIATGNQTAHFALFGTELEDIRAALARADNDRDRRVGAELLAEIGSAWLVLGLGDEGSAQIERFASAIGPDDARLRARLCSTLTSFHLNALRLTQAHDLALEAVRHARASGDAETLGRTLSIHAWVCIELKRFDEAQSALAESEAMPGISAQLHLFNLERRAQLAGRTGDLVAAVRLNERLREAHAALGNVVGEQTTVINLAVVEHQRGAPGRAIELLDQILPDLRAGDDIELLVIALCDSACAQLAVDDHDAAAGAASEGLRLLARLEPNHARVPLLIDQLALVLALRGGAARAAALGAFADAAIERRRYTREEHEERIRARRIDAVNARIAPDEHAPLAAEGARLDVTTAITLALSAIP